MEVNLPADAIANAEKLVAAGAGSDVADVLSKAVAQMTAYTVPREELDEVDGAWSDEIGDRLQSLDKALNAGQRNTIPADEAERMIRGDAPLDL